MDSAPLNTISICQLQLSRTIVLPHLSMDLTLLRLLTLLKSQPLHSQLFISFSCISKQSYTYPIYDTHILPQLSFTNYSFNSYIHTYKGSHAHKVLKYHFYSILSIYKHHIYSTSLLDLILQCSTHPLRFPLYLYNSCRLTHIYMKGKPSRSHIFPNYFYFQLLTKSKYNYFDSVNQ